MGNWLYNVISLMGRIDENYLPEGWYENAFNQYKQTHPNLTIDDFNKLFVRNNEELMNLIKGASTESAINKKRWSVRNKILATPQEIADFFQENGITQEKLMEPYNEADFDLFKKIYDQLSKSELIKEFPTTADIRKIIGLKSTKKNASFERLLILALVNKEELSSICKKYNFPKLKYGITGRPLSDDIEGNIKASEQWLKDTLAKNQEISLYNQNKSDDEAFKKTSDSLFSTALDKYLNIYPNEDVFILFENFSKWFYNIVGDNTFTHYRNDDPLSAKTLITNAYCYTFNKNQQKSTAIQWLNDTKNIPELNDFKAKVNKYYLEYLGLNKLPNFNSIDYSLFVPYAQDINALNTAMFHTCLSKIVSNINNTSVAQAIKIFKSSKNVLNIIKNGTSCPYIDTCNKAFLILQHLNGRLSSEEQKKTPLSIIFSSVKDVSQTILENIFIDDDNQDALLSEVISTNENIRYKTQSELYDWVTTNFGDDWGEELNRFEKNNEIFDLIGDKSIDIYHITPNVAIEYQGEQHYRPLSCLNIPSDEKFTEAFTEKCFKSPLQTRTEIEKLLMSFAIEYANILEGKTIYNISTYDFRMKYDLHNDESRAIFYKSPKRWYREGLCIIQQMNDMQKYDALSSEKGGFNMIYVAPGNQTLTDSAIRMPFSLKFSTCFSGNKNIRGIFMRNNISTNDYPIYRWENDNKKLYDAIEKCGIRPVNLSQNQEIAASPLNEMMDKAEGKLKIMEAFDNPYYNAVVNFIKEHNDYYVSNYKDVIACYNPSYNNICVQFLFKLMYGQTPCYLTSFNLLLRSNGDIIIQDNMGYEHSINECGPTILKTMYNAINYAKENGITPQM